MHLMGIDIGGTKTAVCIGTESGRLLAERRIPTDPDHAQSTLDLTVQTVGEVLAQAGLTMDEIAAIGISSPGPMSSKQRMIFDTPNLKGWSGMAIGDFFERHFNRPVFMQNDANGAGLAEYLFGSCKGLDLVYLTMSTGIGGGIVTGGTVLAGANDLGGEVGHMTLDPNGPLCACGKRGCWEAFCGGKRFAEQFREALVESGTTSIAFELAGGTLDRITMKEICAAVRQGDPFALSRWDSFIERMAQATGILLQTLNPQAMVLGTIAIHDGDLFLPQMKERLPRYAWQASIEACRIEASILKHIGELAALAIALNGLQQG